MLCISQLTVIENAGLCQYVSSPNATAQTNH